ncbi:hypothetical protein E4T44_13154 [Aureobasidium sp. EXF-8845]|nr:hypothetical protein E4T44_13154 [Aureobasidium sp. EXF-8845]KAI4791149.1 hypothetical protein E4T45_13032 [Aureobasidium sp. EXF-8846]
MPPNTPMQHLLLRSRPTTFSTTPLTSLLLQQCPRQLTTTSTRLFTTTPLLQAGVRKSKSFSPHQTGMKQPSQKSFEVMKKEQMKNIDQMPNDVGLIPGTFIMPTGSRLPSDLGKRVKLERYRLWLRVKEIFGRHYMGYFHVSPRADFQTTAVPSIAKSLYTEMYTAFSAGNLSPIAHKLCENIHTSLEQRIATRGPNTGIIWTLHQWTSAPKVVSHKYMPMSLEDNKDKTKQTTIQQVCVRMQSLQSLKKVKRVKQGKETIEVLEEGSSAEPKEVVEYLVVQRLCKRGKMGPWMVWGTTTESNAEEVLQIE